MIGAFLDVDGTLYTAHMWRGLMEYAAQHGRKRQVGFYYAAHAVAVFAPMATDQRGTLSQARSDEFGMGATRLERRAG